MTETELPLPDRDSKTTAQSRMHGSTALQQQHKTRLPDQEDFLLSQVRQLTGNISPLSDKDLKPTEQSKALSSIAPQQHETRHPDP